MGRWNGYTTAVNRSYRESDQGKGYVAVPTDIHDTKEAREWYGSILGTVVFMKWKWVGLHVGDYMILIDTWVPSYFSGDSHILGHPYYILHRYDSVKNYPIEGDERNDKIFEKWEKESELASVWGGEGNKSQWLRQWSRRRNHWERNVYLYRRMTIIFYCVILLIIVVLIIWLIGKRRYERRKL